MSVEAEQTQEKSGVKDTVRVVIHALILALLVRVFLFQPFNIPSGSMIPTLLVGDYLFVSKYSYGYSRYSFPFGPNLFSGRIWSKEPDRGDVVVFKLPRDTSTDYIHSRRRDQRARRSPRPIPAYEMILLPTCVRMKGMC
jgi:signal peptidase I